MNLRYAMGAVLLTFTVGSMTAFADMTSRRVRLETDGGAIEVEAKRPNDIRTRNAVREQLKQQMRKGMPLTNPAILQHQKEIKYKYEKTDRGGRIRIVAKSREALSAVQDFLRSQMTVPEDTKTLTFTFIEGTSLVVLPVTINDRGTFQFLLDTGASHTMLSAKVADSLGIPKGRPEVIITAGGNVAVTIRKLDSLQVGGTRLTEVDIAVTNASLMQTLQLDGILGGDYLRRFKISIDYDNRVVDIEPSMPEIMSMLVT